MSTSRKFSYFNARWKCEAEFFADRLEYAWDKWGLGVQKGRSVIQHSELSPHLTDSSVMGLEATPPLLKAAIYGTIGIFAHALLPVPWRHIEYLFAVGFLGSVSLGLWRFFRKTETINIQTKAGSPAVAVVVTKWSPEERAEFRSFYEKWIKEPNQSITDNSGASPLRV